MNKVRGPQGTPDCPPPTLPLGLLRQTLPKGTDWTDKQGQPIHGISDAQQKQQSGARTAAGQLTMVELSPQKTIRGSKYPELKMRLRDPAPRSSRIAMQGTVGSPPCCPCGLRESWLLFWPSSGQSNKLCIASLGKKNQNSKYSFHRMRLTITPS